MGAHHVGQAVDGAVLTWRLQTGRQGHSEPGSGCVLAVSVSVSERAGEDKQMWVCCTGGRHKWGTLGW